MFCGKCGNVIDDNAKQCPFCGTPVEEMHSQPAQPQQSAPSVNNGGAVLNLDPKIVNYIKLGLIGVIGAITLLELIASIVCLASLQTINILGGITFARVPAIICFSVCVLGAGFFALIQERWMPIFICAGISAVMFIFNFVLYGGIFTIAKRAMLSLGNDLSIAPLVVPAVFLLICSVAMLGFVGYVVYKEVLPTFKK